MLDRTLHEKLANPFAEILDLDQSFSALFLRERVSQRKHFSVSPDTKNINNLLLVFFYFKCKGFIHVFLSI